MRQMSIAHVRVHPSGNFSRIYKVVEKKSRTNFANARWASVRISEREGRVPGNWNTTAVGHPGKLRRDNGNRAPLFRNSRIS